MARINVSELMVDPDFINDFCYIRRKPTINDLGENVLQEIEYIGRGSVQAVGKNAALRLPDGVRLSNFITVYTKVNLNVSKAGSYPDQVVWMNKRYNVFQVLPWNNFGEGWYEVDCEMENATT